MPSSKHSLKSSVKKTNKRSKGNSGITRVYIANVSPEVTKENLAEFIGSVPSKIIFVYYPNGGFKGIGFVDFADRSAANDFVGKNGQEFLGQSLTVRLAEFRSQSGAAITGRVSCFIGNVSSADDRELRRFAGGKVTKLNWIWKEGEFRGYGFVQFANYKDADKFVQKNGQNFQGQSVRINYGTGYHPTAHVRGNGQQLTENSLRKFVGGSCSVRVKQEGKYAFVDFETIGSFNAFCDKNGSSFGQGNISISHCKGAQPSQQTSCFVRGLPDDITEGALKKFAGAGVTGVHLPEGSGYAFVHFSDSKGAASFINKSGQSLRGSRVLIAYPKQQRPQNDKGSL